MAVAGKLSSRGVSAIEQMHQPNGADRVDAPGTRVEHPSFGTAIFELRQSRGMPQRALATLTGLQPSAKSAIENLRQPPPRERHVSALGNALTDDLPQRQHLQKLASAERKATKGSRIGRHTPRRVAHLIREMAMLSDRLTDTHIAALRAQLMEAAMK